MKLPLIFLVVGIVGLTLVYRWMPPAKVREEPKYVAPPKEILHFTFGYRESIADGLWLRVIQDFDFCGQEAPKNLSGASIFSAQDKYGEKGPESADQIVKDILEHELPPARCNKGWVFHMLDRITDLVPRFRMPYIMGATLLSVAVDDREGARLIYEKGMLQFPSDWSIAYRAAYHYLYEIQDGRRAAQLLDAAARNGAPQWVVSLAARLFSQSGKLQLGITVLEDAIKRDPKGVYAERIKDRLKALKTKLKKQSSGS